MALSLPMPRCLVRSELQARDSPPNPERQCTAPSRVPAAAAKQPRKFSLRSSTSRPAVAVASAPPSSPPSIEDRKTQVDQSSDESTPFRVIQVDAAEVKDFYTAPVLAVADVAPGVRCVTVEAEVSREFVPLDVAYTKPGQSVLVRASPGEGKVETVPVSSAPFNGQTNFPVLYKLRGDIPAGSTKAPQFALSVRAPLDLHVSEARHQDLYNLKPGDAVDVGHFTSSGMDLRPIMFLSRFPTLLIFASSPGSGIATARALIEADDVGSLYTQLRADVRLYCSARLPEELAYSDWFSHWEKLNVRVRPVVAARGVHQWEGTVGDFADAFEMDDLEYDPDTTAAVVCGDKASNELALRVLEDAGVPQTSILVWQS